MSLSIIIVNYKTPALLTGCLRSIAEQTIKSEYEIIVVDNDSGDNSREQIHAAFPLVKWIQMDYNAGFARANNAGIMASAGDTVLLLNSDTLIENNAIEGCYQLFHNSNYVASGVQLLNADRTPQIAGNYFMSGGLNNLLPLPYMGAFIKWLGNLFRVNKPHVPDSDHPVEVDWINGAFLMVKKSAIEKAGLMDEDFFLYSEEAEWCYRLKKIGRLIIYGQFKVIHLQGETSKVIFNSQTKGYYNLYDRKGFQIMLSNFVRIRKQYGQGWFLFHLFVYSLNIPIYYFFSLISSILFFKYPSGDFSNAGKFTANVMRLWSYALRIFSNRPYFYKVL